MIFVEFLFFEEFIFLCKTTIHINNSIILAQINQRISEQDICMVSITKSLYIFCCHFHVTYERKYNHVKFQQSPVNFFRKKMIDLKKYVSPKKSTLKK